MKKIVFLFSLLLLLPNQGQSQNAELDAEWERAYQKAKVATFYSATYANGWEELEKAMKRTRKEGEQHFLNSCQNVIQKKSMGFFESVVQLVYRYGYGQ